MRTLLLISLLGWILCAAAGAAPTVNEDAARRLLQRWLDVQNRGDFAGYRELYAEGFQGVRRSGKRTARFDRAGWLADRERMFRKPMKVSAAAVTFQQQPPALLFEQTWASGSYRDVGQKRLLLGDEGGAPRILGEELLASELRPEPLKPEDEAAVRCLFPVFDPTQRKVGGAVVSQVQRARYEGGGTVALVTLGEREVLGVCDAAGQRLATTQLPEAESYEEACVILGGGRCSSSGDADRLRQNGGASLRGEQLDLAPGRWAIGVERHFHADTSTDAGGPGEEFHWSSYNLYVLDAGGQGTLRRVLRVPYAARRSDVELSDSFQTSVTQVDVGLLSIERTVRNGVYPDGVKERTRESRLRWDGKRLVPTR